MISMEKEKNKFCLTFKNIVLIFYLCVLVCLTAKSVSNFVKKFAPITFESEIYSVIHKTIFLILCLIIIVALIYKWKFRGIFIDIVNKYKYYCVFFVTILVVFSYLCFNENHYSLNDLEKLINIQWTIYAIVSALYVFWHGFTIEKIKQSIPKKDNNEQSNKKNIAEDIHFYNTYSAIITPILLLGLNTILLLLGTYFTYVMKYDTINTQNIVLFGLILTGNSLVSLMLDIIIFEFKFKYNVIDKHFVTYKTITETINNEKSNALSTSKICGEDLTKRTGNIDNCNKFNNMMNKNKE